MKENELYQKIEYIEQKLEKLSASVKESRISETGLVLIGIALGMLGTMLLLLIQ